MNRITESRFQSEEERITILFLDDETRFLDSTKRMLRHMRGRWNMQFYSNQKEALTTLDNLDEVIVVVTDWMMPMMDGLRFFEEARRRRDAKQMTNAYFIVLTGRQGAEDVATALNTGFDDFIRKPFHTDELIARVNVGIRIIQSDRELRIANEQLELLATTDPLTGLYNRRHGSRVLEEELAKVSRHKQHISLVMADIDHFKKINDTYGHEAGDRALSVFSAVLVSTVRSYDITIRWGGEEFLMICPATRSTEVKPVAERLLTNIRNTVVHLENGTPLRLTASLGTSSTDLFCLTPPKTNELIAKADEMLYLAKTTGRNRVCHMGLSTRAS